MIAAYVPPRYTLGEYVTTAFIRGVVKEIVHGRDKNWGHDEYYYLVKPTNVFIKPHWVLESEIYLAQTNRTWI